MKWEHPLVFVADFAGSSLRPWWLKSPDFSPEQSKKNLTAKNAKKSRQGREEGARGMIGKSMLRILWLGFIICGFSCVLAQSQTQFADAVLIHGHIYTVDANHP